MKIIMIAVTSANGKITRGDDSNIYSWTSKEDQDFFFDMRKNAKLIIMGAGTYESIRSNFNLAEKDKLRIVLTSTPEKYSEEQTPGVLEFSSETPSELVTRIDKYDEVLLLGGSKVFSSFMKGELVDELYLTIEPVVFGQGKPLFSDEDFDADLKLEEIKQLNLKGTILLKYKIER